WVQAIDDVLVAVEVDAASRRAVSTDAFLRLEIPDPLFVEEVLAAQRPDRTEVDDVAGELVVERFAGEDVDLGMMAAMGDLQLGLSADLAGEADAASTHDTAIGEEGDVVADI